MYIPKHFETSSQEILSRILPEASFVTLVTMDESGTPFATHLPVSYHAEIGEFGVIRGHVARANPHWQLFAGRQSLVIFAGPHGYISPRDYANAGNVPTWNYVAVHAYGEIRLLEKEEEVREILATLTSENENAREKPWSLDEIEPKKVAAMMKAIVAFEMPVIRLEGKAKLGQNKSADDKAALKEAAIGSELQDWQ